jgi:hypothetical protein
MPLSFADFVFASLANYSTGPRSGEPTKVPPADTANGMIPGTPVSAEDHNYLYNLIGLALTELKALPETALTWTLAHVFRQTLTVGGGLVDTFANALAARLQLAVAASAVGSRTCWLDTVITGTKLRGYVNVDGSGAAALEFTLNAGFANTDSLWHKDTAGVVSAILRLSREHVRVGFRPVGSGAWDTTFADPVGAGWLLALGLTDDGLYVTGEIQTSNLNIGNLAATAVEATDVAADSVVATVGVSTPVLLLDGYIAPKKLMPKAWALLHVADSVTGDVEIVDSSDNVTAVARSGNEIRLTFGALADVNYAAFIMLNELTNGGDAGGSPNDYTPIVVGKSTTRLDFKIWGEGGVELDLTPAFTFDGAFAVIIMGNDA